MGDIIDLTDIKQPRAKPTLKAVMEQCNAIEDECMEIDSIICRLYATGRITAAQKLIEAQQILNAESAFLWAHANGQYTTEITRLLEVAHGK